MDLRSMDLLTRQQFWLDNKEEKQFVVRREVFLQQEFALQTMQSSRPVHSNWDAAKRESLLASAKQKAKEEERRVS